MEKNRDKESGLKLVLSVIYPFGSFLYSWKDLKARSTYWAFFIFFVVYGLCFTANIDTLDSFFYVEDLESFSADPSYNLSQIVKEFFSKDSTVKDLFVYLLYYLTSILAGGNYHVFFCFVAIVFGYFFLRSLRIITEDIAYKNTILFLILALIFTLSNPIFNINGVRFWTAAWIAVYATFQILIKDKKQYLFLLLFLPFVHGSYYVYLVFFALAYCFRRFYRVLPYVFFISFFITDVTLRILPDITIYLPPFLQNMIWAYTESDYALSRMSGEYAVQEALYARVLMAIPNYFHVLLIYLLVRSRNHFKDDSSMKFLGFLLGYGTLVNISSMIPSMLRYWNLLIPFYVYLFVHNNHIMNRYKSFVFLYPIIALYPTFRLVRFIIRTTDPVLFFSNLIHIIIRALHIA